MGFEMKTGKMITMIEKLFYLIAVTPTTIPHAKHSFSKYIACV